MIPMTRWCLYSLCLLIHIAQPLVIFRRSIGYGADIVLEAAADTSLGASSGSWARPGRATTTHTCNNIRGVPAELRTAAGMFPDGLDYFYQKYTEAYGIPIVSSNNVPDDALKRACYVVRFMFADHSGIRQSYYMRSGRMAVMARPELEVTTSIPEHRDLDPYWNQRARGMGSTDAAPVCVAAEENLLCYSLDTYTQDIGIHEFAHGVHLLGAKYAIPGFDNNLKNLYEARKAANTRWANTYSMSTKEEYFAEGVQSFFNVNAYANPPNGINNHVSTRDVLQTYDPELFALIQQAFPCANWPVDRCENSRYNEHYHDIRMDCNPADEAYTEPDPNCMDQDRYCYNYAEMGYCSSNRVWMERNCRPSCNLCDGSGESDNSNTDSTCTDADGESTCVQWKEGGYCTNTEYSGYMEENCKKSCGACSGGGGGGGGECTDKEASCSAWADVGLCTSYSDYMNENCEMTCGICGGGGADSGGSGCADSDTNCQAWADYNYCSNESVIKLCPKACQLC